MKKSGFIAIIGETNSGKSTLLNLLIKTKVSIVSHKVQTTRHRILGIINEDDKQIVFIDTPGIFKPHRDFDKKMIKSSYSAIADADIIIVLLDAAKGITEFTNIIINHIPKDKKQILVINKLDLLNNEEMLKLLSLASSLDNFNEFFVISATKNKGIDVMLRYLFNNLPHDNWFFNEEDISDQSVQAIATEITREKIYQYLHEELPYGINVESEKWDESEDSVIIYQQINVAKDSYKSIVLGKDGSKIKTIRMSSQKDISDMLNKRVSLFLHIKINNKWLTT